MTGDFGRMIVRSPFAIVRPERIEDVVVAMRRALDADLPIVARGQGHSTRGQSSVEGGILVDTSGLSRIEIGTESATVGAGATWDRLLRTALERDLTPPTLTDYLGLSIGGTLSVGGVGGQSFRHGLQVDNVEELTVVTGRGEIEICSRLERPELFDAVRGGLGQCGIIVEAKLRLVAAPKGVEVDDLPSPDLRTFLAMQEELIESDRYDYFLGSIRPGRRFNLEAVKYVERSSQSYLSYATRLDAMVAEMKRSGTWEQLHPWMDLFLPASSAHEIIESVLEWIDPEEIGSGDVMTYPLVPRRSTTPLASLPEERHAFLFDLLPNLEPSRLGAYEGRLARIVAHASALGARVYPIGYPVGTEAMDWRHQLGGRWERFAAAKATWDPRGLLNPGVMF